MSMRLLLGWGGPAHGDLDHAGTHQPGWPSSSDGHVLWPELTDGSEGHVVWSWWGQTDEDTEVSCGSRSDDRSISWVVFGGGPGDTVGRFVWPGEFGDPERLQSSRHKAIKASFDIFCLTVWHCSSLETCSASYSNRLILMLRRSDGTGRITLLMVLVFLDVGFHINIT